MEIADLKKALVSYLSKEGYAKYVRPALAGAQLGTFVGGVSGAMNPGEGESRWKSSLMGSIKGGVVGAATGIASRATLGATARAFDKVEGRSLRARRKALLAGEPHSRFYSSTEQELAELAKSRQLSKDNILRASMTAAAIPTALQAYSLGNNSSSHLKK